MLRIHLGCFSVLYVQYIILGKNTVIHKQQLPEKACGFAFTLLLFLLKKGFFMEQNRTYYFSTFS